MAGPKLSARPPVDNVRLPNDKPLGHGGAAMNASELIAVLNATALVTMMLAMGLRVGGRELLASARPARRLILGLVANYVLVPAITLGLLKLFRADPMVSVGFLILASCPGAPVGPPITAIVRGDVPWAVGMMLILAGLSALLTPALLGMLLPWVAPGTDLHFNSLGIVRILLVTQLLPLALGLGFHHAAPGWTRFVVKPIGFLANALLLTLVGAILATQFGMLAAIRPRAWFGMSLLLTASLGLGWSCGGPGLASHKALAMTTATRNVAVGLVIAGSGFKGTLVVTAVVAYGLFSILGTLGCAHLLGRLGVIESEGARDASPHQEVADASPPLRS
jgi:BASS family bile acid:Na+ symporter